MTSTLPVHHCSPPTPIITSILPFFCLLHRPFVPYSMTPPGFGATVRVRTRARPLVVRPGSATSSALQFWESHLHSLFPFCYLSGSGISQSTVKINQSMQKVSRIMPGMLFVQVVAVSIMLLLCYHYYTFHLSFWKSELPLEVFVN